MHKGMLKVFVTLAIIMVVTHYSSEKNIELFLTHRVQENSSKFMLIGQDRANILLSKFYHQQVILPSYVSLLNIVKSVEVCRC